MLQVNKQQVRNAITELLRALGEDPCREGLLDTPDRVARMWAEFINYNPGKTGTAFEHSYVDQMVVVKGMRVWSMCEHHLLPFWCDLDIGYVAEGKVLGLSKFARIAHEVAHGLQLQERLVNEIADAVAHVAQTTNVAVMGTGQHLCMTMRGIKTPALMKTSVMRGVFRVEQETRMEFLEMIRREVAT